LAFIINKYFKFNEDVKYFKDIYEAQKKFMGSGFKRSVTEKTLCIKNRLDFRNSFLNIPGANDLLKEIKVIEEIEKRPKGNLLTDEYEYKNLGKISINEITQRVCGRYYKRKFGFIESKEMPLYGWIYSETVGWTRKRPELKLSKYKYNQSKHCS